ncbi:hypothetical protein CIRMBP1239_02443 [Enterococcus cecorum]|nr:hypothetical protein CIRMBP1239_02443 [Enterococcus cecorum]
MFELKDCTVEESKIAGLKIIRSKTVTDDRGTVRELYRGSLYTTFYLTHFLLGNRLI